MFIDASAILAILNEEDLRDELETQLASQSGRLRVSPLARFEAVVSLARARAEAGKSKVEAMRLAEAAVDAFVEALGAREVEISAEIGRAALEAGRKFGKFVGHRADLNFGDCFAYACAKTGREPLLYKRAGFPFNDVNDGFEPLSPS